MLIYKFQNASVRVVGGGPPERRALRMPRVGKENRIVVKAAAKQPRVRCRNKSKSTRPSEGVFVCGICSYVHLVKRRVGRRGKARSRKRTHSRRGRQAGVIRYTGHIRDREAMVPKTEDEVIASAEEQEIAIAIQNSSIGTMSGVGDEEDPSMGAADESRKSERKRQRERQRRSDLASAFDELASLITQIENPAVGGGPILSSSSSGAASLDHHHHHYAAALEDPAKRQRRRRSGVGEELEDSSGLTRLDLIGRTVGVLRRLQQENAELRGRLMEGGGGSGEEQVCFPNNLIAFRELSHPKMRLVTYKIALLCGFCFAFPSI